MLGNLVVWFVLLLVTVALGWLAVRAFRSHQGLVKWVGGSLAALLTLLFGLVSAVPLVGMVKFYTPRGQPVQALQVAGRMSKSRAASTWRMPFAWSATRPRVNFHWLVESTSARISPCPWAASSQ